MHSLLLLSWAFGCAPEGEPITLTVVGVVPPEGIPADVVDTGRVFSQAERHTFDEARCVGFESECQVRVPSSIETRVALVFGSKGCGHTCLGDGYFTYQAAPLDPVPLELICDLGCIR